MPDFPAAVPDIPDASTFESLFTMHQNLGHAAATNRILANLRALATKIGISSSSPTSAGVLRQTAAGQSAWGLVQGADIGSRVVTPGNINAGGTSPRILGTTDGISAAWSQVIGGMLAANSVLAGNINAGVIFDAQVSTTAGILLSKLAAGAAGLLRSNGSVITAGNQVAAGDLAPDAVGVIRGVQLGAVTATNTLAQMAGAQVTWTPLNKPVRVVATLQGITCTANATLTVALYETGNPWGNLIVETLTTGQTRTLCGGFYQAGPGTGSHRYDLYWSISTGSASAAGVSFSIEELH